MSVGASTIPTATIAADAPGAAIVRAIYRDGDGNMHVEWPPEKIEEAVRHGGGTIWVDFQAAKEGETREVEAWLHRVFPFHPLAVEDALKETNLPKVDDWSGYLYVVFRVPRIAPGSDVLEMHELDIFLGPNYLVTFHVAPMEILEAERAAIARDPRDRLRHGPDHLLFRILERAVDQALTSIEELDERVDDIQDAVLENATPKLLRSIFRIKRSAIHLHKTLGPQREVLNRLARDPYDPIREEHRVYFRDLYDHVVRIHDISESLRDLIAGTLETYLSVISNRTNDIMKTLTMVTVMFLPMSFLAGFFGMNFFGEPLALKSLPISRGLLFALTCGIMAISPCFMWIYAKRRRWF
jgi:magnesium transporter